MSIKAKIEAIIYAAEEPVTLAQITELVKEAAKQEIAAERARQAEAAAAAAEIASDTSTASGDEETSVASEVDPAAESTGPLPITDVEIRSKVRATLEELIAEYSSPEHGMEVRQIASGYRIATKPEHHDLVRAFAKSLKPPVRLSLQALETLAVIAYKQPVTAPEISEIRGVDSGGVLATLLDRKLITTAGRKAVIGRPILYKTTKEFLLRFGLKDVNELPSMEEFEKLAQESLGADLFSAAETAPEAAGATASESEGSERGTRAGG